LCRKRDRFAVNWNPILQIRKNAGLARVATGPNFQPFVPACFAASINENDPRACFRRPISGMKQDFIVAILASKLPGSFKKLKKLADYIAICGFYIDTDRQLKSLTEGGNRFLMDSQPLFKEDQTEQNLVIVLST